MNRIAVAVSLLTGLLVPGSSATSAEIPVDVSSFQAAGGVTVRHEGERLAVEWPTGSGEVGRLVLNLRAERPLIAGLGLAKGEAGPAIELLKEIDPVTFVTVGSRVGMPDHPAGMSRFNEFFDSPAKRPHATYRAKLEPKQIRVTGRSGRATIAIDGLSAGPFTGRLQMTIYAGAALVHVESVVSTEEQDRAFFYDAGLVSASPSWGTIASMDTGGNFQREGLVNAPERLHKVKHRAIVAESPGGSVACFPPPHQYFFPRDYTDNLATTWSGPGHLGIEDRVGFGIRQAETGGGSFSPWFNAPPGSQQHIGVFYLITRGKAEDALRETLRFTHNDRFPDLPGYQTFSSHWHMAITMSAIGQEQTAGGKRTPDLVKMFKDMNVRAVHLAEFHGDGHPQDPGPLRLAEMEAMFAECRRLSDDRLLLLPGEEANVYLGPRDPKTPQGHWLYLFPKPVTWTMRRGKDQPFAEERPGGGTIYHIGNRDEMARLIDREHGLAWTAHARIKSSSWTPDAYKDEDFYKSDSWLGAAWKAMPADLSRPRLGERCLDLLDDMANWGPGHKYLLGEVDVFKIDHTHELYGHMNINYIKIDHMPKYADDWSPILDALRRGRFFVTTGEVLVRDFSVGGKGSGETLAATGDARPPIKLDLEWTFPLRSAVVVSGDGIARKQTIIDLGDTTPFGRKTLDLTTDLKGQKWVRVEAWDVAGNGAFTQPVWLEPAAGSR
jgi:hypothetical protein